MLLTVSVLREAATIDSGLITVAEAVRASTTTLAQLRLSRRETVAQISRGHAEHVANGGQGALGRPPRATSPNPRARAVCVCVPSRTGSDAAPHRAES